MAETQLENPTLETASPATSPALPLVDDETLDTFLREPAKVARLPVPPTEYRREFQRMIVSAFLQDHAA
ncbi:MAG TPA: hypothetical protein VNR41_11685 [Xanthobacteraceae bacterium]|jgi:hypothetical protein|nr:hypothetical protein [Xanthobacteraceae bacterium]